MNDPVIYGYRTIAPDPNDPTKNVWKTGVWYSEPLFNTDFCPYGYDKIKPDPNDATKKIKEIALFTGE